MRDLTDVATWEDDLTNLGPEQGDEANGDEVSVIGDKLGNRTRFLREASDALTSAVLTPEIMTRHQWRPRPLSNCRVVPFFDAWAGDPDDYVHGGVVGTDSGAYFFECELDLAHNSELNQVRVYVYGSPTATVTVWRVDLSAVEDLGGDLHQLPATTRLGTGTARTVISGTMGYYSVTVGGTEIVDRTTSRYVVQVRGANGTDLARWFSTRPLTLGTGDKAAA